MPVNSTNTQPKRTNTQPKSTPASRSDSAKVREGFTKVRNGSVSYARHTAERTVDVTLPPTAAQLPVPAEFLRPGGYKTEVLTIDQSGNQTLTEVAFTVA